MTAMYRAFNLRNIKFDSFENELLTLYNRTHKNECRETRQHIENFLLSDYDLDGSTLKDAFFPTDLMPDVFISHSHDDENSAKTFAQYLESSFGITSFIDSTVWGGFTELQESLDDYFIRTQGADYSRDDHYRIVSHVHLMLNTALMQMIDRCEAFFLLNTPQSVSIDEIIGDSTYSPWIFSEIGMFHLVEKRRPQRQGQESLFSESRIKQRLNLSNFTVLRTADLNAWCKKFRKLKGEYRSQGVVALDVLYDMKP